MLNAQLSSVGGFNPNAPNRQFVGPPQRQRGTLNSPGTPRQQNPFGGSMVDGGGFPGPPSPSPVGVSAPNFANPVYANQQMRLQRQGSVPPQSTQHLPGSPRSAYGGHGPGPDATGYGMMFGNAAAMQQHTASSPGDFYNRSQTGKRRNVPHHPNQKSSSTTPTHFSTHTSIQPIIVMQKRSVHHDATMHLHSRLGHTIIRNHFKNLLTSGTVAQSQIILHLF
uniref:Uncharacterized protein n=1 Tax=Anopheles maculatus TaxID=74869 RepID=A0A182SNF2_9DIPT